jgi:hypothetical protein
VAARLTRWSGSSAFFRAEARRVDSQGRGEHVQVNGEGLDRLAAEPRIPAPNSRGHKAPEPWRKWAEAETPAGGAGPRVTNDNP